MMRGSDKPKTAWLWAIVPFVVLLEILFQWKIPRNQPSAEEWIDAAEFVKENKKQHDLVIVSPSWAVQGRMFLGASILPFEEFGHFDTTRYARIIELSLNGSRSKETAGLEPKSKRRFGRLMVMIYDLPPRAEIVYNFIQNWKRARFEKTGKQPPILTVDHWFNPRYVQIVQLGPKSASISFPDVPLEGVIHGHGIIDYRSGRFGKGDPVSLSVFVNDRKLGESVIRNWGPLEAFEFKLPGMGKGMIRFEVSAPNEFGRVFGFAADVRRKGTREQ
jgi:hypothetical protein